MNENVFAHKLKPPGQVPGGGAKHSSRCGFAGAAGSFLHGKSLQVSPRTFMYALFNCCHVRLAALLLNMPVDVLQVPATLMYAVVNCCQMRLAGLPLKSSVDARM